VISFVVLTEDTSKDAPAVWKHVLARVLTQVDPHARRDRYIFHSPSLDLVGANMWKSKSPRHHRQLVTLRQFVATRLLAGDVVFFHVDGDRAWSEAQTSENVRAFAERVTAPVRLILQGNRQGPELDRCLGRLLRVSPFYSVEAWLFQNTHQAARICRERYQGRDAVQFEHWFADRARLDEVVQVKESVCLGSDHNLELATGLTNALVAEVRSLGKSLAATVDAMSVCTDLVAALAETHKGPS
jgi:hypothetical protein